MSKFFINRPIVAMVISIVMVLVGALTILSSAGRPVSQHRSAGDSSPGHLRRRRRANPGASGCHSHRAADERRGQHELHVFAERHRQLDHQPDRGLRRKNRPEHGFHSRPKPRNAGRIPASGRRHQLRRHGSKVGHRSPHADSPCTRRMEPTTPTFLANYAYINLIDPILAFAAASATFRCSAPANTRCGCG